MKLSLLELITFYSLKFFSLFICQFSRKVSILFGTVLGDFIRIFIPVRKKVAIQNLKIAFRNLQAPAIGSSRLKAAVYNSDM